MISPKYSHSFSPWERQKSKPQEKKGEIEKQLYRDADDLNSEMTEPVKQGSVIPCQLVQRDKENEIRQCIQNMWHSVWHTV